MHFDGHAEVDAADYLARLQGCAERNETLAPFFPANHKTCLRCRRSLPPLWRIERWRSLASCSFTDIGSSCGWGPTAVGIELAPPEGMWRVSAAHGERDQTIASDSLPLAGTKHIAVRRNARTNPRAWVAYLVALVILLEEEQVTNQQLPESEQNIQGMPPDQAQPPTSQQQAGGVQSGSGQPQQPTQAAPQTTPQQPAPAPGTPQTALAQPTPSPITQPAPSPVPQQPAPFPYRLPRRLPRRFPRQRRRHKCLRERRSRERLSRLCRSRRRPCLFRRPSSSQFHNRLSLSRPCPSSSQFHNRLFHNRLFRLNRKGIQAALLVI